MASITLDPYIFYRGNCKEAMEFYQSIFGGDLYLQTYGEANMGDETQKDWVMHAALTGGLVKIMASDTKEASAKSAKISLSLGGDDEATLRPIFEKLAQDGDVFSDLKKEFWGDIFGSLTDKFGVEWMVNISAARQ